MISSIGLFRTQLRKKAIEALNRDQLIAKNHILDSLATKISQDMLPAIYVSTPHDSGTAESSSGPSFIRKTSLLIQCFINYSDSIKAQETLDQLCYGIEHALFCDIQLNAAIEQFPSIISESRLHTESTLPIAEARLILELQYRERFRPDGEVLTQITTQLSGLSISSSIDVID